MPKQSVQTVLPNHSQKTKVSIKASDIRALVARVSADYPELKFVESTHFSWGAGKKHVSFKVTGINNECNAWALLHEIGHALLGHADFHHDIELLQLEVAAWEKARTLANQYRIDIDENYLQDCLDTYRDWLHVRATCPTCSARSLQASAHRYYCFNCNAEWRVTRSRLCRPYRLKMT